MSSSSLVDIESDQWLTEYKLLEKLDEEIGDLLILRGAESKPSDNYTQLSSTIVVRLKQFDDEIQQLKNKLKICQTITPDEEERREKLIEQLKNKTNQYRARFNQPDTESQISPTKSPSEATARTSEKSSSDNEEYSSQNGTSASDNGKSASNNGKSASDNGKSASNNGNSSSDNGESSSQNGTSASDNGKSASDNGKSASDNGRSASNNGKSASDNGKSESDNGKSESDDGKSESDNGKSSSDNGKSSADDEKSSSDNGIASVQEEEVTSVEVDESEFQWKEIKEDQNGGTNDLPTTTISQQTNVVIEIEAENDTQNVERNDDVSDTMEQTETTPLTNGRSSPQLSFLESTFVYWIIIALLFIAIISVLMA